MKKTSPMSRLDATTTGGFSLVEIMIAMALSLLLLAGVATMFVSSKTTYEVNDRLTQVQENGRFALETIMRDIRGAGYLGCFRPGLATKGTFTNTLNTPTAIAANYGNAVTGFDFQAPGTWAPLLAPADVPNVTDGGDVIAVRLPVVGIPFLHLNAAMTSKTDDLHVDKFTAGTGPFHNNQILMLANCQHRTIFEITNYDDVGGVIQHNKSSATATSPGNASDDLGYAFDPNNLNDGAGALVVTQTTTYYIGSTDPTKPPSLWRRNGTGNAEELVDGIQDLQMLFGVNDSNDRFVTKYVTANNIAPTDIVVSVSVGVLACSLDEYGTKTDTTTYDVLDDKFKAPGDRRLRQVFSSTAMIRNNGL